MTPLERERQADPGTEWLWQEWMKAEGHAVPAAEQERTFRRWLKSSGIVERDHGVSARYTDRMAAAGHGEPVRAREPGRRSQAKARFRYDTE